MLRARLESVAARAGSVSPGRKPKAEGLVMEIVRYVPSLGRPSVGVLVGWNGLRADMVDWGGER